MTDCATRDAAAAVFERMGLGADVAITVKAGIATLFSGQGRGGRHASAGAGLAGADPGRHRRDTRDRAGAALNLVRHLKSHDVDAVVDETPLAGRDIGQAFRDHVAGRDVDLLVMGGSGPRIRPRRRHVVDA